MPGTPTALAVARSDLASQVIARFGGNPLDPDTMAVRDWAAAILGSLAPAVTPAEIDEAVAMALPRIRDAWNAVAGTFMLRKASADTVGPFVPTDFSNLGGGPPPIVQPAPFTYVGDGTANRVIASFTAPVVPLSIVIVKFGQGGFDPYLSVFNKIASGPSWLIGNGDSAFDQPIPVPVAFSGSDVIVNPFGVQNLANETNFFYKAIAIGQ